MGKDFDMGYMDKFFDLPVEKEKSNESDGRIMEIDIENLIPYHTGEHPFEVEYDEDMQELEDSIMEHGILEPIYVRRDKNLPGRFEIMAGHRRTYIAQKIGLEKIRAALIEYDDEDAKDLMVVTNLLKRKHIKPSVAAKAYKMYLGENKRQGKRTDLTSSHDETKLRTDEEAAAKFKASRAKIQRYVRLNELIPEILLMVDEGKVPVGTGSELSHLSEEEQIAVLEYMKEYGFVPTVPQANQIKDYHKEGNTVNATYLRNQFGKSESSGAVAKVEIIKKPKLNEKFINEYLPQEMRKRSVEQKRLYTQEALIMFNNYLLEHPEEKEKWETEV